MIKVKYLGHSDILNLKHYVQVEGPHNQSPFEPGSNANSNINLIMDPSVLFDLGGRSYFTTAFDKAFNNIFSNNF